MISKQHPEFNILQSNEYYPFGLLTANSWTRDNTRNNFLYNEGSELNTTTGLYDLPFRNYDAALGRFFQVDPLAHMSSRLTPYHYANNNPIAFNDPSGAVVPYYAKPEDNPMNWRMTIHNDNPYFNFGGEPIGGGSWSDDHSGAPPAEDPYGDAEKLASHEMTMDEYLAKYSEDLTSPGDGDPRNDPFPKWMMAAYAEKAKGIRTGDDRILDYLKATTLVGGTNTTAWCAAFVNWCLQQAGLEGNKDAWAPNITSYGEPSQGVFGAVAYVIGDWFPNGHAGFVVYSNDDYVWMLGGNQSKTINILKIPTEGHDFTFRWPGN